MQAWISIYIFLYALLSVLALREQGRLGAPQWKLLGGALVGGLGAAGMIFYVQSEGHVRSDIASIWRFVFPCLVLQSVIDVAWDLAHGQQLMDPKGELEPARLRRAMVFSLFGGLFMLAPYFYFNYRVAYGPA